MKKGIIVLVVLILVGFIPFQQRRTVSIKSNYFDVCQQLIAAGNWKRWVPEISSKAVTQIQTDTFNSGFLITTPNQAFKVKSISGNTYNVVRTLNHIDYHYTYTVVPAIKGNNTAVVIDAKTNVFKWLVSQIEQSAEPDALVLNLKSFMEDAKRYYGFTINEKNVAESYIAVKKETIATKNKYPEINKAVKGLNSFIEQNNIKAIQPIYGSYYPYKADSLQILIGIPVNKQLNPTTAVSFMRMPGGKVVVGDYQGKYGERQKVYAATEKYIQDHFLQKQIAPFERYLDNKVPANDSDIVNMQINYPVL
jgi:effector-binding domain-containing protein